MTAPDHAAAERFARYCDEFTVEGMHRTDEALHRSTAEFIRSLAAARDAARGEHAMALAENDALRFQLSAALARAEAAEAVCRAYWAWEYGDADHPATGMLVAWSKPFGLKATRGDPGADYDPYERLAARIAALEAENANWIANGRQAADQLEFLSERIATLEEGLQGTLFAMESMMAEVTGDMSDENLADLWNAAVAKARAILAKP